MLRWHQEGTLHISRGVPYMSAGGYLTCQQGGTLPVKAACFDVQSRGLIQLLAMSTGHSTGLSWLSMDGLSIREVSKRKTAHISVQVSQNTPQQCSNQLYPFIKKVFFGCFGSSKYKDVINGNCLQQVCTLIQTRRVRLLKCQSTDLEAGCVKIGQGSFLHLDTLVNVFLWS